MLLQGLEDLSESCVASASVLCNSWGVASGVPLQSDLHCVLCTAVTWLHGGICLVLAHDGDKLSAGVRLLCPDSRLWLETLDPAGLQPDVLIEGGDVRSAGDGEPDMQMVWGLATTRRQGCIAEPAAFSTRCWHCAGPMIARDMATSSKLGAAFQGCRGSCIASEERCLVS